MKAAKRNAIVMAAIAVIACGGRAEATSDSEKIPLDGRGGGVIAYSVTYADNTNRLFLVNADGSGNEPLASLSGRPLGPAWSPDAKKIALYNHESDAQWSLVVMNADGSSVRQLSNRPNTLDWSPSWSPDGRKIIFTRSVMAPVWKSEIWTIQADGGDLARIGDRDGQGADYSPDGNRIAYFNYVDGGGDIWAMNSDGTDSKKLTDHHAEDWWPNWSPDGRRIAFQSKRDGNFEIYVMNAAGGNLVRLTSNSADDEEPRWSPDGRKIAFSSLRDGHYEIYVMNADGSDQRRITHVNGHAINPRWKPGEK